MELGGNSKDNPKNNASNPKPDLEPLLTLQCPDTASMRATCLDFNKQNNDLLAVGYRPERSFLNSQTFQSKNHIYQNSNQSNPNNTGYNKHTTITGNTQGNLKGNLSGNISGSNAYGSHMGHQSNSPFASNNGLSKENSHPNPSGSSFKRLQFLDHLHSQKQSKLGNAQGNCKQGMICFWTVKNPNFPERIIRTHAGVSSLKFCNLNPYLLGVGLEDGTVAIYDLRKAKNDQ